jgi:hypothetical protein
MDSDPSPLSARMSEQISTSVRTGGPCDAFSKSRTCAVTINIIEDQHRPHTYNHAFWAGYDFSALKQKVGEGGLAGT